MNEMNGNSSLIHFKELFERSESLKLIIMPIFRKNVTDLKFELDSTHYPEPSGIQDD